LCVPRGGFAGGGVGLAKRLQPPPPPPPARLQCCLCCVNGPVKVPARVHLTSTKQPRRAAVSPLPQDGNRGAGEVLFWGDFLFWLLAHPRSECP